MNRKITIDKYLDKLAEANPVPGGGSAAALIGAIGISLLSMVARYTTQREFRKISYKKLAEIIGFTKRAKRRLRKLMSEDEAVYSRLSKEIRRKDTKDITGFYKDAAEVPLEVCSILQSGLKNCEKLCPYCKTALVTDLAEAALFLETGFLSAKLNVEINLDGIKDRGYKQKIRRLLIKETVAMHKVKNRVLEKIRMHQGKEIPLL